MLPASIIPSAPRPTGGGPEETVRWGRKRTGLVPGLGSGASSGSNGRVNDSGKSLSMPSHQCPSLENGEMGMVIAVLSCWREGWVPGRAVEKNVISEPEGLLYVVGKKDCHLFNCQGNPEKIQETQACGRVSRGSSLG